MKNCRGLIVFFAICIFCLAYSGSANASYPQTIEQWQYERGAEFPNGSVTTGRILWRGGGVGQRVHGQIGCTSSWTPQAGHVEYVDISTPATDHLLFTLRYSKNTAGTVPLVISVNGEERAAFQPQSTGNWNVFTSSSEIDLGPVGEGLHSIKLSTNGQQFCVLDADHITLSVPWQYERGAEFPNGSVATGRVVWRGNAIGQRAHGQIGCTNSWTPQAGHVEYMDIPTPATDHLLFTLRYSKNTAGTVPLVISVDGEERATFQPQSTGNWNVFTSSSEIDLGPVGVGLHSIKLSTSGQQFCVLDADHIILSMVQQEN